MYIQYNTADLSTDKYCFAAQNEDDSIVGVDKLKCRICVSSKVKIDTVSDLLNHNSAHILYDPKLSKEKQYCGLCLDNSGHCRFHLQKSNDDAKNQQLDLDGSVCPKLQKFSYAAASKSKTNSPSSNAPIHCPFCDKKAPAVWRYNLRQHLSQTHPSVDPHDVKNLWQLSKEEKTGLHKVWERLKSSRNTRGSKAEPTLKLSNAHSSLLALR